MQPIQTPVPGLRFYENVIPDHFHDEFVKQLNNAYYEKNRGHYDGFSFRDDRAFDAIFYPMVEYLFGKMKELTVFTAPANGKLRLGCTLIGYEANGSIPRHIDAVQLSGDTVAVFSFNSPCVVNFYEEDPPKRHEKILIPVKSMYVMGGDSRRKWSHEILANEDSYQGKKIGRTKRYSLLFFEPGPAYREELLVY
jgi:alkylated DNA repair dioxygenase AlkB